MLLGAEPADPHPRVRADLVKGVGRLRRQAEFGQQALQPLQGSFGLLAAGTHHHRVVGIAHQHPVIP
ncbi:hypothetical protein [Streptomyces sp. NPDC050704]|uniref:hypothetical protein n=1 Tax=Streptomyces sp. NPDC050704 TaxID=3157219 RepID=UPI0034238CBD